MRNDGGPAFACAAENGHQPGMTLRDYFAAAAMGQMLHAEIRKDAWAHVGAVAVDAYKMADAMIAEREKP